MVYLHNLHDSYNNAVVHTQGSPVVLFVTSNSIREIYTEFIRRIILLLRRRIIIQSQIIPQRFSLKPDCFLLDDKPSLYVHVPWMSVPAMDFSPFIVVTVYTQFLAWVSFFLHVSMYVMYKVRFSLLLIVLLVIIVSIKTYLVTSNWELLIENTACLKPFYIT